MPRISLRSFLGNHRISFNGCVLQCCAALLQHFSYTTCALSKSPKKITLRLPNVCSKISQLDQNNSKDASVGQPLAASLVRWQLPILKTISGKAVMIFLCVAKSKEWWNSRRNSSVLIFLLLMALSTNSCRVARCSVK